MPGMAASTSETFLFGSAPNAVEAPENSFDSEITWAWTSSPITISHSPVLPLSNAISLLRTSSRGPPGVLHTYYRPPRQTPTPPRPSDGRGANLIPHAPHNGSEGAKAAAP